MRKDAIRLEEERLRGIDDIREYPSLHERHRIFPGILELESHKRILDIAAGMGVVGKRIQEHYQGDLLCNDICPKCVRTMQENGLQTVSFDIDDSEKPYPFPDGHFSAIIALASIEHLIHVDHFVKEIHRLLDDDGCLYLSAPNYSGLAYLMPFLLTGRTFHDPFGESSRYEFYAHIRYFTYRTLLEFVSSFGFAADAVYLAVPEGSSRFKKLKSNSKTKALTFKYVMKYIYKFFSPRWAAEPVVCFRKSGNSRKVNFKPKKIVL